MGEPTWEPPPGRYQRRGGAVMFWVGLVVAAVSLVAAGVLGFRAYDDVRTAVEEARPVEGPTTVTLEVGEAQEIYQFERVGERAECTVTGPDGREVPVRRTHDVEGSTGEESNVNVGGFEAGQAGDHVVECTGPQTYVGPRVSIAGVVGGVFAVVGGSLGAGLGLLLALVGVVLWFVGRYEDRQAVDRPPSLRGYRSGGHQPGGYRPGGYRPGGPGDGPPPPSSSP